MRTLTLLLLLMILTLNSCTVVKSLLGYDECAYEGCERQCKEDCNYCAFHCDSYTLPSDFNSKVDKSIKEQLELYKATK